MKNARCSQLQRQLRACSSSDDDHAVWSLDVPKEGRYAVWLDWACDAKVAGKRFVLETANAALDGKVTGTGTWDNYRQARVGELDLAAGAHRLTFRPSETLRGTPLIDLKAIKLVPVK